MNWVTDPVTNNCLSSPYPVLRSGGRASPARTQTAEIVLVCTQHVVDTQKSSALEGIDVDASDHGGRSAYTWGVAGELGEVVELLRNAGAGPHEPSGELPPYRVAGGMSRPRVVDGPETRSTTASPLIFRWRNRNRRWGRGVSNWQTERAVVLEVIVKRNGKTEFVRFVQKPYDDAELDKKFIEEAEKQEFEPATLRGKPVDAVVVRLRLPAGLPLRSEGRRGFSAPPVMTLLSRVYIGRRRDRPTVRSLVRATGAAKKLAVLVHRKQRDINAELESVLEPLCKNICSAPYMGSYEPSKGYSWRRSVGRWPDPPLGSELGGSLRRDAPPFISAQLGRG